MKKAYTKPEIAFDSFGMDNNFATTLSGSCTYNPTQFTNDCGIVIAGRTLFVAETSGCKYVSADGTYGVCYYVPTGDNNVFIS